MRRTQILPHCRVAKNLYFCTMQKRKQVISTCLAVLFMLYYANTCFFYHNHVINGVTIVHSHFHSDASGKGESHTENELELITKLSVLQTLEVQFVITGPAPILFLTASLEQNAEKKASPVLTRGTRLRAPPQVSFS